MTGVRIAGLGHYVPERRVANAEIEQRLDLAPGWIKRRTGIDARRYVSSDEALSDIAVRAGEMALANAGIARDSVALLLLATSTPDHLLPPSAPLVAQRLSLAQAGAIDMAGACGGFVYALTLADAFVRINRAPVLVIAANILSRRINERDRASSVLFADAAGAAVLSPSANADSGVIGSKLIAAGAHYDLIRIPGGGSRRPFSMISDPMETLMVITNGQAVYAHAVAMMTSAAREALERADLTPADVDHFIPHQANARMMRTIAHQLAINDNEICSTIAEYANSSAATIPLTMSSLAGTRRFKAGDILLLTAAGAGMTGGAVAFRW